MSLYADYLKERTSDEILENEWGFATYRFPDEKTVYLVDLYIVPEHRKNGLARMLGDQVAGIAAKRGCTAMIGSVVPSAKNSAESMKVLLAYGMRPVSSGVDFVFFKKEIT